jgi:hypothetical protein
MASDNPDLANLTPEESEKNPILDEMWRRGVKKRDEVLGSDYFSRLRDFWAMRQGVASASRTPTFRPQIQFSDLHWMAMQEAGDLTDNNPVPIITGPDGARLSDHEKALRGQWFIGEYNLSFFNAVLEALLAGTGFLMMVHDYSARRGRGNTVLKWLDTENVVVDDGCTSFRNWQYLCYRSKLSLDEIRRCFPRQANRLPRFPSPALGNVPKLGASQGESPDYVRMPPGPMQQMSIGPLGSGTDTRVVEYFLLLDDGRKVAKDIDGDSNALLNPDSIKTIPAYPNGRLIIRCDRVHLFDGPIPYRRFNFIPVQIHPSRNNFWAPPPIRYVVQLQEIAQTLTRQNIENVIRLNNGLVLINQAAGLKADDVQGLPGERILVNSTDGVEKAMKILTPPQFGGEAWAMPDKLLDKMKRDFGFNETRQGKAGAGNTSGELFGNTLSQASGLTQVRGRLLQPSVKLALEMVYETMLQFQNAVMFPLPNEQANAIEFIKWAGADPLQADDWELLVDPASMKAMSSSMARQYALLLRQAGILPVLDTLVALGWPDAERIAAKVDQDLQMQLLSKESTRGAPRKR